MVEGSRCALGAALSVVAAIAALAFLRSEEGRIPPNGRLDYRSSGWFSECAQWDPAHHRFLVSFIGAGLGQVAFPPGLPLAVAQEESLVSLGPDLAGFSTLGFKIDSARHRVLAAIADSFKNKYSALVAYDTRTWKRIFLTKLAGPERASLADDVAFDPEGNIYVTDAVGGLIWKVRSDGSEARVLTASQAFKVKPQSLLVGWVSLNGIVYHPEGFLLVSHTGGNAIFKVSLDGQDVRRVDVEGTLFGDGIDLVRPDQLAVASLWTGVRLVESKNGWLTANVTHLYSPPRHRFASAVTIKDGDVFVNYLNGFGIPYISTIAQAVFTPLLSPS